MRFMAMLMVAVLGGGTQIGEQPTTEGPPSWRTSFDDFAKAIAAFPIQNIPNTNPQRPGLTGLRVSGEHEIMKRFGGPVEFAGTFQKVSRDFDSVRAKPTNRERVEIEMVYPAMSRPTNWTVYLYPKASALKEWKALTPETPVRFRAIVTGIAQNQSFLPGVDLRWYSILLEDAELVAQ